MRKGAGGIEFVVAMALFLTAFWFIYLQGSSLLTYRMMRSDVRHPAAELFSDICVKDSVDPAEWGTSFGLAYGGGTVQQNILDASKLDAMHGQPCPEPPQFSGLSFKVYVQTKAKSWECSSPITEGAYIERPVYVRMNSGAYKEGLIRVYAA